MSNVPFGGGGGAGGGFSFGAPVTNTAGAAPTAATANPQQAAGFSFGASTQNVGSAAGGGSQ